MKNKPELATAHATLLAQFKAHLQTLNYSKGTVINGVSNLTDFFNYLETTHQKLEQMTSSEIKTYFDYLETRTNQKTGLGLSLTYLQKIKSILQLFYAFLENTQATNYPKVSFPEFKKGSFQRKILTQEEIKKLYNACDETLLGKRNKALLSIYYGCGLRRQEGTALNVEDIDFNKAQLFIKKSKTHQQRYVPMSAHTQAILEEYLYNTREKLIDKTSSESGVLVTENGKRLSVETVTYILAKLLKEAKIQTKASPHTLRHSIATHLLKSGMKLESIALFLGHKSLDSTQIYTHEINKI